MLAIVLAVLLFDEASDQRKRRMTRHEYKRMFRALIAWLRFFSGYRPPRLPEVVLEVSASFVRTLRRRWRHDSSILDRGQIRVHSDVAVARFRHSVSGAPSDTVSAVCGTALRRGYPERSSRRSV